MAVISASQRGRPQGLRIQVMTVSAVVPARRVVRR